MKTPVLPTPALETHESELVRNSSYLFVIRNSDRSAPYSVQWKPSRYLIYFFLNHDLIWNFLLNSHYTCLKTLAGRPVVGQWNNDKGTFGMKHYESRDVWPHSCRTENEPSRTLRRTPNRAHKQPSKHFVSLSPSPCVLKKPAAALQKYSPSLNSDPEILESCFSKPLCCEMTSTSPMEQ